MKRFSTILLLIVLVFGFAGISGAGSMPYNIGNITEFLNDPTYFNAYTEITDPFPFTGEWWYTAIAFESGNINYIREAPTGPITFTTANTANFGAHNSINFNTDNLYFSDGDPENVALNAFDPTQPFFRLFELTEDSSIFDKGTIIVGYNDNGIPGGDLDFDDIVAAMAPKTVPEASTMILLGIGLIGLTGFRRKIKN